MSARRRRRVAGRRGFLSSQDLIGVAVVGGFLAYAGARSFDLSAAIEARASAERAAVESAEQTSAEACVTSVVASDVRFDPRVSFAIEPELPGLGAYLTALEPLEPKAASPALLKQLFDAPMQSVRLEVSTVSKTVHPGNMWGRPGGTFVALATRGAPCVQPTLPSDAELAEALAKKFFGAAPFGSIP